jgi:hypothetical protein
MGLLCRLHREAVEEGLGERLGHVDIVLGVARHQAVAIFARDDGAGFRKAALLLIVSALSDVDHLNESRDDFASNLEWIFHAADRIPHTSYLPGLERISKAKVGWLDTVELRKLISRCRSAKSR